MILGIDQGTTGTTAIVMNAKGKLLAHNTVKVPQHFPKPGWVEHHPEEIWKSVQKAVVQALKKSRVPLKKIRAIGITNQRETVSLFKNSKPLHPFIVWQDRRTSDLCRALVPHRESILQKSGLPIDPYFSGTKIKWLMSHLKLTGKESDIRFRTIDSFLIDRLTGRDFTEVTNASRTSLLNLNSLRWDQELLDIYGIPAAYCPPVIPSEGMDLKTRGLKFLPDGIPIRGILGDQQAALFGQLGWNEGDAKITFGTGSFILVNTGETPVISKNSLVSTVAIQFKNGSKHYALEGSAFISGAWIQFLRDQLKVIPNSEASEKLARGVETSEGVMVIPALSGMGAPFWKPDLRGAILGLTRGTNLSHLARASLEALCYQNRALVEAIEKDLGARVELSWRVDGGAVANDLLMQIQADVLNKEILRPRSLEATAIGVAELAGISEGILEYQAIRKNWKADKVFKPNAQKNSQYTKLYEKWLQSLHKLAL